MTSTRSLSFETLQAQFATLAERFEEQALSHREMLRQALEAQTLSHTQALAQALEDQTLSHNQALEVALSSQAQRPMPSAQQNPELPGLNAEEDLLRSRISGHDDERSRSRATPELGRPMLGDQNDQRPGFGAHEEAAPPLLSAERQIASCS